MSRSQQILGNGILTAVNIGLVDAIPIAAEWHEFIHKALLVIAVAIGVYAQSFNSDGTPQEQPFVPTPKGERAGG